MKSPPRDDRWKAKYEEPEAVEDSDLPELPEGWCWTSVEEAFRLITSGSRDWSKYYGRGTGTFIMAQNVKPGRLDFSAGRQLVDPPEDDRDRQRSQVEPGDLLITIVGANTGDVCPVHETLPEHFVCQSVALVRLVLPQLQPWIMRYFLNGAPGRRQLERVIYGQGRPHLSFDDLKGMPVPLAPIEEQAEILNQIRRAEESCGAVHVQMKGALDDLEAFDKATLSRAFRGELVPQDPGDEPASVLLERIRAERHSTNGSASKPRRRS